MDDEKRVEALEGEFKLLKSEIKQTLSSVRDFLLDIKLPAISEEAPVPDNATLAASEPQAASDQEALSQDALDGGGADGSGGGIGDGSGGSDDSYAEPEPEGSSPFEAQEGMMLPEDETENIDAEDTGISSGEMPSDEMPEVDQPKIAEENPVAPVPVAFAPGMPQVNMLANLIRWAAEARREIGMAQLPVFLDIYATSGYLLDEMKENILHLAEVATDPVADESVGGSGKVFSEQLSICMEIASFNGDVPADIKTRIRRLYELILAQNSYANKADVWSQMLLKLHGILINGGSPVQPVNTKNTAKQETEDQTAEAEDLQAEENGLDLDGDDLDADLTEEDSLSGMSDGFEDEDGLENTDEDREVGVFPSLKNTRPAKLRLILPVGDGAEQELDLGNLFIAADTPKQGANRSDNRKKTSSSKR